LGLEKGGEYAGAGKSHGLARGPEKKKAPMKRPVPSIGKGIGKVVGAKNPQTERRVGHGGDPGKDGWSGEGDQT